MTLRRFLKRDLIDFRLHWIILALVMALTFAAVLFFAGQGGLHHAVFLLSQICGLFGFIETMRVFGGVPRQRSCLSRPYLLSLPIKRKELILIQHARSLVYWIPLVVLGGLCPLMPSNSFLRGDVFYYPALIVTIVFLMEFSIHAAMVAETTHQYSPKGKRFASGALGFLSLAALYILMIAWARLVWPLTPAVAARLLAGRKFDFIYLLFAFPWPQFVFPVYGLLLIFLAPYNARKWCVAL